LLDPQGQALGTLCVIDRRPRELTDAQRQALRVLGRQVMGLLERRPLTHELAGMDHGAPVAGRRLVRLARAIARRGGYRSRSPWRCWPCCSSVSMPAAA
jgi:GAF domain-containing protein